jgi:hypothetical protein
MPKKNKIEDLRDHLFETLEMLKDPDKPMELERAKTISAVAQTIINSAKVEVELARALRGQPGSDFLDSEQDFIKTSPSQIEQRGVKRRQITNGAAH